MNNPTAADPKTSPGVLYSETIAHKGAREEIAAQRQCLEGCPFIGLADHIIVKLAPKIESVGSIKLTDQTGAQRLYGLVLSIGPEVDNSGRLEIGDIIMFSAAGRQQLKLSELEQEDFIAISAMMVLCKVDPAYVLAQGLKLPFLEVVSPEATERREMRCPECNTFLDDHQPGPCLDRWVQAQVIDKKPTVAT